MHPVRFGTPNDHFEVVLPAEIRSQGWARARVKLAVEGFVADVAVFIDRDDFARFASELEALDQSLSGVARLEPLERQVSLRVSADHRGRLTLKGELRAQAGSGTRLEFEFELDQTFLREPLAQLQDALRHWAAA